MTERVINSLKSLAESLKKKPEPLAFDFKPVVPSTTVPPTEDLPLEAKNEH